MQCSFYSDTCKDPLNLITDICIILFILVCAKPVLLWHMQSILTWCKVHFTLTYAKSLLPWNINPIYDIYKIPLSLTYASLAQSGECLLQSWKALGSNPGQVQWWPCHYNNVGCSAKLEISFELNLLPRVNKVTLLYFTLCKAHFILTHAKSPLHWQKQNPFYPSIYKMIISSFNCLNEVYVSDEGNEYQIINNYISVDLHITADTHKYKARTITLHKYIITLNG